ncbi:MAG: hypothetical protein IJO32_00815 [Bacilli bacterium]|nr:hypothetical protein [Bacilli bacterium]
MENEKRLKQIDWSIIGIIIIISLLIHSIYLLINEKKRILDIDSISDEEFVIQALINRSIASAIVLMFFLFNLSNYLDTINNPESSEDEINSRLLNLITSSLALIATLVEVFSVVRNYILLKENNNN